MDEKVFELIRSDWGNKRYLAHEKFYREHPGLSIPIGQYASLRTLWDAEEKVGVEYSRPAGCQGD